MENVSALPSPPTLDREGARSDDPAVAAPPGRPGNRVGRMRDFFGGPKGIVTLWVSGKFAGPFDAAPPESA